MAKVFGSFSRLVSLLFRKNGQDITLRPNQTVTYNAAQDLQLPPEIAASSVLVSEAASQILTNKAISGASNTLSNIPTTAIASGALPAGVTVDSSNIVNGSIVDADINASAAIALSKLATGALPSGITVDSSNIVNGSIVDADVSASAAISLSKLATGALPSGITVDSSNITNGSIVDVDVSASAAIARSKLAAGTANRVAVNDGTGVLSDAAAITAARALISDANGIPTHSAVTSTELGYVSGVTSAIQTQLDGKQPLDSDLTAVAGLTTTGLIARTGSGTAATRTVTGTANRITVTNGDGVSGNPTLDVGTNVIVNNGNTTGNNLVVGTNDNFDLRLEAGSTEKVKVIPNSISGLYGDLVQSNSTAGWRISSGTTAQRPSLPEGPGYIRHNTDTNEFEGFTNSAWQAIGGGVNELPLKNYLKTYATAAVAPGTLSTVAANGNIATTVGLFYADATSGSAALVQSSSTALRGSFNYLSALSGADTAGGRFFQFPAFALESADLGKPISLSFDLTGLTAAGWDVVVARYDASGIFQGLIPVAGTASSSTSTPSAQLPTGTVRGWPAFFVSTSDAGHLYALRFRRLSGSEQVRLDTLYVGPQAQLAGAPVTDWQSYTPTFTGFGTTSSVEFFWRRVGDSMEINGRFTSGTPTTTEAQIGLPSGTTISLLSTTQIVGKWVRQVTSATTFKQGTILANSGQTYVRIGLDDYTTAFGPLSARNADDLVGNTQIVSFFARVPIAGWSSNTTMADRAVEEYAFNTSGITTAGASDTTSFGYGPAGAAIGSIASTTASSDTVMRVRFQTAIQATDRLVVEVSNPTTSTGWIESSTYFPRLLQGSSQYGIRLDQVNNTDCDVRFGNQGAYANNATYAGSGLTWASAASGLRWRVRKVSGGAAVGFPVGARNVVGDTTGTAVPTGYIGQVVSASITSTTGIGTSEADVTGASIALTPGSWLIQYFVSGRVDSGATLNNESDLIVRLTDGSNNAITGGQRVLVALTPASSNLRMFGNLCAAVPVNISANTTYKLRAQRVDVVGTGGNAAVYNDNNGNSNFFAVRVG